MFARAVTDGGLLDASLRLGLSFVLALPLGWDSEQRSRSGGLRTYPLLSACVCGFLLLAQSAGWDAIRQADAFYGVLSGIGFVGSGAIVKSGERPSGMRTAVSLWATGAIGAGVSYGVPLYAAALSLMIGLALGGASILTTRRRSG